MRKDKNKEYTRRETKKVLTMPGQDYTGFLSSNCFLRSGSGVHKDGKNNKVQPAGIANTANKKKVI